MEIDVHKISGVGDFTEENEKERKLFLVGGRVFLVVRKNTVEVRTDKNLRRMLCEQFESVMESRYFGKGGVEVVLSGQIPVDEVEDLVRLSYNLTAEMGEE